MLLGLPYLDAFLLFGAGLLAAAANAIAGGGTFLTFPAFLATGVPAVTANASNAVAIWPGRLLVIAAYRRELARQADRALRTGAICIAGGITGAWALLQSSDQAFLRTVPWLLLIATLLLLFDRPIQRLVGIGTPGSRPSPAWRATLTVALFLCAAYGGFFGGGLGVILMPLLSLSGVRDIQELNALKNLLVTLIAGVAVTLFVISGAVSWPGTLVMMAGGVIGGYCGGAVARHVPAPALRAVVIFSGFALAAYYFWNIYLRPAAG
ncbi:sulfite exporter TauE/SafE family protein [Vineibacter terrae]|uniref:Probable membrane transporter protein n=1 Tax=Vineibacter terrae TaxID=2586908 RepID=A0A5C8PMS9_9HYPH|nr:sulfite exporter TauE/SafE family protein [Vineibacter terrae]TXL74665.1 sulfite exporter TauE/SafE family protein [Vineibacter terrae]